MKKLIAVMAFAGVLSIPSVIFADASWYGSLRGGVIFGGGGDASFKDGNSRWGVKGSNELANGLSAVYRFETKVSTMNAASSGGMGGTSNVSNHEHSVDSGGRLAYVGLSGGFGSLSMGQIWNAGYNSVGAITDPFTVHGGNALTPYRIGSALSYANSVGNASFQIDAIMDKGMDTGDAVDGVEFGMTIGLGDIGKIAVAYLDRKDERIMKMAHVPAKEAMAAVSRTPEMYYIITAPATATAEAKKRKLNRIVVLARKDDDDETIATFVDKDGKLKVNISGDDTVLDENDSTPFETAIVKLGDMYYAPRSVDGSNTADSASAIKDLCVDGDNADAAKCQEIVVYKETIEYYKDNDTPDFGASLTATNRDDAEAHEIPDAADARRLTNPADTTNKFTTYFTEGVDFEKGIGEEDSLYIQAKKDGTPATAYVPASTEKMKDINPGYESTHVAVEFGLGDITAWVGHSRKEKNGGAIMSDVPEGEAVSLLAEIGAEPDDGYMKSKSSEIKINHFGVRGSLGDNGLSYIMNYRSEEDTGKGTKTNPYAIGLYKGLGDGASAIVEHANADMPGESGKTWVGLRVDF